MTSTPRALLAALATAPHILRDTSAVDAPLHEICCNSRAAAPGDLFVCIRGAQSDGHDFAAAAYAAGCRVFLCEREIALPPDAALYLSSDTRRDLAHLAAAYYGHPARRLQSVGITGTKGKTTVALLCYHVLAGLGEPVGYIGTSGIRYGDTHIRTANTTPDPLILQRYLSDMVKAGVRTVLMEVSSQALWQKRVEGIPFAAVALTNIHPDHIGVHEHPDMAHYMACKRRLLTDFGAPIVIGNADDETTPDMMRGASGRVVLCGIDHAADYSAEQITQDTQDGLPVTCFDCHNTACGEHDTVRLPLSGLHNVQNALMALAILHSLGYPRRRTAALLADARVPGRFEMVRVKGALVVIDYAHNGAALTAALTALRALRPRRLLCLVGSVGERSHCRRRDLGRAADTLADFTYLTADDPGREPVEDICRDIAAAFAPAFLPRYTVIPDRVAAIRQALDELGKGDILLLAGKGDERVIKIGGQVLPHHDRSVVEAYLADHIPLPLS